LNLDAAGATNSVFLNNAGVAGSFILNGLAVRNLLEEALLDAANAAKAVSALAAGATNAQKAAAALPFQYSPVGAANTATIDLGSGIADGIYFGAAAANVDGEVFFGYAVVNKNLIETLIVEGTRLVDGEIVLLTTLGDAEFVATGELVDGKDDFYELIPGDLVEALKAPVQQQIITELSTQYDFTSRGVFGQVTLTSSALSQRFGAETLLVVEEIAKQGIDGMVAERAAALGLVFRDTAPSATPARNVTNPLYSQQVYNPAIVGNANLIFPGVAFTRVSFESSNRDVLDVDSTGRITVRRLEVDGTATVTMRLEFDSQEFTYTTTYRALTVSSYNREILNQLHAVQLSTADTSITLEGRRVIQGLSLELENPVSEAYTDYSKTSRPFLLVDSGILISTSAGVTTSGVSQAQLDDTALTGGQNFGWFLNYGQSTARAITNLSQLTPGTYTLTAVIQFDTTGTTPLEVTRRVSLTVLSAADATAAVLAGVKPGSLLPGGLITTETAAASLSRNSTILGVVVDWTISTPTSNSFTDAVNDTAGVKLAELTTSKSTTTLNVTRNYSDQKLLVRASLGRGYFDPQGDLQEEGALTGNPIVNYEFTVRANSVAAIRTRVLTALANQYRSIPNFVALGSTGATLVESLYVASGASTLTLDIATKISFGFATTEVGYVVLPGTTSAFADVNIATLSGVDYYVIVRTSGGQDVGSGLYNLSGFAGGSGLTGTNLFGSSGATDIPFLVIDAQSGEVFLNDDSFDAFDTSGIVAPKEFKFTIFTRVRLSVGTNPAVYEIDDSTLRRDVVLFKNPSAPSA
jgi:hypothetical protein